MCGICGEIRTKGDVRLPEFWTMTRSMQSRGPDAEGVLSHAVEQGAMAFGHRRLAILDQSSTSQHANAGCIGVNSSITCLPSRRRR